MPLPLWISFFQWPGSERLQLVEFLSLPWTRTPRYHYRWCWWLQPHLGCCLCAWVIVNLPSISFFPTPLSLPETGWTVCLRNSALFRAPRGRGQRLGVPATSSLLPGNAATLQIQSFPGALRHRTSSPCECLLPNDDLFPLGGGILPTCFDSSKVSQNPSLCPHCPHCCNRPSSNCETSKVCFFLLSCAQHSANTFSTALILY